MGTYAYLFAMTADEFAVAFPGRRVGRFRRTKRRAVNPFTGDESVFDSWDCDDEVPPVSSEVEWRDSGIIKSALHEEVTNVNDIELSCILSAAASESRDNCHDALMENQVLGGVESWMTQLPDRFVHAIAEADPETVADGWNACSESDTSAATLGATISRLKRFAIKARDTNRSVFYWQG